MIDFNKRSHTYHKLWKGDDSLLSRSAEQILNYLQIKMGSKVLDVCCGTGILTKKIKERVGSEGLVLGIDEAINMLKIANGSDHTIDFINCTAEKFKLNELFDSITCQFGLEYILNLHPSLTNMRRHLKGDGTIGIVMHGTPIISRSVFDECLSKLINMDDSKKSGILDLKSEIQSAGMSIKLMKECDLQHKYKNFQEYFQLRINYKKTNNPKLYDKLSQADLVCLEQEVQKSTQKFTRPDTSLVFPHKVVFAVARIPRAVPASRWPPHQRAIRRQS